MQTLVIPAAIHQAAGELIYNDDLTVLHHIVDVLFHQAPGLHGLVDVVIQRCVVWICQIFHSKEFLCLGNAGSGEGDGAVLLIDNVIAIIIVLNFLLIGLGEDQLPQAGDKKV